MWAFKLRISHVLGEQFPSIEELLGATSLLKKDCFLHFKVESFSGLLKEFIAPFSLLTYIEDISKALEIQMHSVV